MHSKQSFMAGGGYNEKPRKKKKRVHRRKVKQLWGWERVSFFLVIRWRASDPIETQKGRDWNNNEKTSNNYTVFPFIFFFLGWWVAKRKKEQKKVIVFSVIFSSCYRALEGGIGLEKTKPTSQAMQSSKKAVFIFGCSLLSSPVVSCSCFCILF